MTQAGLTWFRNWFSPDLMRADIRLMRRYLRERNPIIRTVETAFLWLAALVSVIPFWVYILDTWEHVGVLAFILVTIYLAQLMLTVRVITLASYIGTREMESGTWDSLVLTGISARQIVCSKWLAVLRITWLNAVAVSLLRVGAVVGLSAFLHSVEYKPCLLYLATPLCYRSQTNLGYLNYDNDISLENSATIRSLLVIVAGCVFYGVFSICITILLTLWSSLQFKRRANSFIGTTSIYLILNIAIILLWFGLSDFINQATEWLEQAVIAFSRVQGNFGPVPVRAMPLFKLTQDAIEALKSFILMLTPLIDNGLTTLTNAFRDVEQTRAQVIRSLFTMGVGLALLIGMTALLLKMAIHAAGRRAALQINDEGTDIELLKPEVERLVQ